MNHFRIYAQQNPGARSIDIHVFASGWRIECEPHEVQHLAQPVNYEPYEYDGSHAAPTLSLDNNGAQQLMDQLWNCGIRPTEGAGSAGSLAATERHLQDMREIAFQSLCLGKP